jgi:hypothetical protein
MLQDLLKPRSKVIAAALVVALPLAALLLSGLRLLPSVVVAAEPDAQTWYTCTPANVTAYTSRIHVKCTAAAAGGIWYFAYPTRDPANASRFLSLLSTAAVAGKQVGILYETTDTSGVAYGCAASDCRPIIGVALLP